MLSRVLTSPPYILVGGSGDYLLQLTNNTANVLNLRLTGVTSTPIGAGTLTSFTTDSSNTSFNPLTIASGGLGFSTAIGAIAAGEPIEFKFTVTPTGVPIGGLIRFFVQIEGDVNATLTRYTFVADQPGALTLTKIANPSTVGPNGQFTTTITATNTFDFAISNLSLIDSLPNGIQLVSSTPEPDFKTNNRMDYKNLTINPNDSFIVTIIGKVVNNNLPTFTNIATLNVNGNNIYVRATATVTFVQPEPLSIGSSVVPNKVSDFQVFILGSQTISYENSAFNAEVIIYNNGPDNSILPVSFNIFLERGLFDEKTTQVTTDEKTYRTLIINDPVTSGNFINLEITIPSLAVGQSSRFRIRDKLTHNLDKYYSFLTTVFTYPDKIATLNTKVLLK